MDPNLIYTKTPIGDEAVRQSSRVVNRNLRMVLVQVDGKATVGELSAKIGNPRLVTSALRELEEGGYIAPPLEAVTVWEFEKKLAEEKHKQQGNKPSGQADDAPSSFFGFTGKGKKSSGDSAAHSVFDAPQTIFAPDSQGFSSFGKPILPTYNREAATGFDKQAAKPAKVKTGGVPVSFILTRIAMLAFALLIVLALAAVFFPYSMFKPEIEAGLSRLLQKTVKVTTVGLELSPTPRIVVKGGRIGDRGEISFDQLSFAPRPGLLWQGAYAINEATIAGVVADVDSVANLPIMSAPTKGFVLKTLNFERLSLSAGNVLRLNDLSGEFAFLPGGQLEKGRFYSSDRALRFEALPKGNAFDLVLEANGWRPFPMEALSLDSFKANARYQSGRFFIQEIDTLALGGLLTGSWLLEWQSGTPVMAGELRLQRGDVRRFAAVFAPGLPLDGEMTGQFRVRTSGNDVEMMKANLQSTMQVDLVKGGVIGFDLGRAVRVSVEMARSGQTRFDVLRADVTVNGPRVDVSHLMMDAGPLVANGDLVVSAGKVDGHLNATLTTPSARRQIAVKLGGTPSRMSLENPSGGLR